MDPMHRMVANIIIFVAVMIIALMAVYTLAQSLTLPEFGALR